METRVQKWGNSIGVRISREVAEKVGLREGTFVDVEAAEGAVIVRPVVSKRKYKLSKLLAGITEQNRHEPVDYGGPVGGELI